ncbi:hypothetical protein [Saccharibacillus endophyticus]|uniref:Uncharacterized protein n=1 Tax=Saccharibacillus endophyticus TaxID=2060666 RepID=A0ABQ1ZPZ1_9BACL|nr:hypothetical protein [Saccharibacillus endophyticus]GGH71289.1 hypothetical protein GCM10007362_08250 [Saccharibacillus endophyticus]
MTEEIKPNAPETGIANAFKQMPASANLAPRELGTAMKESVNPTIEHAKATGSESIVMAVYAPRSPVFSSVTINIQEMKGTHTLNAPKMNPANAMPYR